jgi:predicted transcriptional regulator
MPVGDVQNSDMIMLETDSSADEAVRLMKERNQRCVLASYKGEVVGILSKTDILNKVISEGRNPSKVHIREIMTSPVVAVDPQTTIEKALSIMKTRNIKQIMVHAYSAAIGIVYIDDIYNKMESLSLSSGDAALQGAPACIIDTRDITYTKNPSKAKFSCPYCGSPFDTKEGLSKHIDRLHEEAGVLEGNVEGMFK